jgi:Transposase, Mutator family
MKRARRRRRARRVEKLVQQLGVELMSKSQVSRLAKSLDAIVDDFRTARSTARPTRTWCWTRAQPDPESVSEQHGRIVAQLQARFPEARRCWTTTVREILAFSGFPKEHWRQLWSNNSLERLNKEGAGVRRMSRESSSGGGPYFIGTTRAVRESCRERQYGAQTALRPRPKILDDTRARFARDVRDRCGDENRIVQLAHDGNEIRHEVDRRCEVRDQQQHCDLRAPRDSWVAEQPLEQHDTVGDKACDLTRVAVPSEQEQDRDQQQPQREGRGKCDADPGPGFYRRRY